MFKKTKLILPIILILLYSCNDDYLESVNSQNSSVVSKSSISNVAKFKDQASLDADIQSYREDGTLPTELDSITSLYTSNISRESTDVESLSEDTIPEDTLIVSDVFRHFLNDRREICVGNVFFRITPQGSFFTTKDKGNWLDSLTISNNIKDSCIEVTTALGYSSDSCLYQVSGYDSLYVYDTFHTIGNNETKVTQNILSRSTSSTVKLTDDDLVETDYKGTLVGKAIDKVLGFSKSVINKFDKKHRANIKFYSVNYKVYAETGVKSKYQKRGWTHIWKKTSVDEIQSGYRLLALRENYKTPILSSKLSTSDLANYRHKDVSDVSYYLYSYGETELKNKTYFTFYFIDPVSSHGVDANNDYSIVYSLIKWCKDLNFSDDIEEKWGDSDYTDYAICFVHNESGVEKSAFCALDQNKSGTSTSKVTYIVDKNIAIEVSLSINLESGDTKPKWPKLKAKTLQYADGAVMYGAVRKGDTWKGVKFDF